MLIGEKGMKGRSYVLCCMLVITGCGVTTGQALTPARKEALKAVGSAMAKPFKAVGKLFEKDTWIDPNTNAPRTTLNLTKHLHTAKNYVGSKVENLANRWEAWGAKKSTWKQSKKVSKQINELDDFEIFQNHLLKRDAILNFQNSSQMPFIQDEKNQKVTSEQVKQMKQLQRDVQKQKKVEVSERKAAQNNKSLNDFTWDDAQDQLSDRIVRPKDSTTKVNKAEIKKFTEKKEGTYDL